MFKAKDEVVATEERAEGGRGEMKLAACGPGAGSGSKTSRVSRLGSEESVTQPFRNRAPRPSAAWHAGRGGARFPGDSAVPVYFRIRAEGLRSGLSCGYFTTR